MRHIDTIVIHHSVSPKNQTLEKSVQSFNRTHKERLHPDPNSLGYHIAYHYLISGKGEVKKTREEREVGYHASNLDINKISIGICLIGNFDTEQVNPEQLVALRDLIQSIKSKVYIKEVVGHRKYAKKSCPGKNMTDVMIAQSFKPEPIKSLTKSDMIIQKQGEATLYLTSGYIAIPFNTDFPTFLKDFRKEDIIVLSPSEFKKFTIANGVILTKK